jgi:transcriptional regulator with XRE-family HTH domain
MSALGDWCCPSCGAGLRRTRAEVEQCDPCQRAASALVLDPALWDEPALSAALARLDFGPVFLRVRAETGWSQHRLAELLTMDQSTLSKIENGKRSLTDAATVIRCANVLAIPAGKLGLCHGVMVGSRAVTGREGSWVDRRGFVGEVAGLTLGAGLTGLDLDRLIALLPQTEPTGTRHVGATDVQAIEAATAAYRLEDFAQGSGMVRDTAGDREKPGEAALTRGACSLWRVAGWPSTFSSSRWAALPADTELPAQRCLPRFFPVSCVPPAPMTGCVC